MYYINEIMEDKTNFILIIINTNTNIMFTHNIMNFHN